MKESELTEYIDNESTDLELENDLGVGEPKPYDPEKIRVDTNQFSLRNILDMIYEKELDLAPDFQRFKVWTEEQKSRLVESVLLRIPLPAFYFSSDKKGHMQVVDGVQRLTTLWDYVRSDNSFPLIGLEYLGDRLGGKRFRDLETEWVARINRTQLTVNIIDPQTPHRVKFDIFKRLNTGGAPLTAQEIRHCMSQNRSRLFLKRIVETEEFGRALPLSIVNHKRMANREMVLRAAAFWLQRKDPSGINPYTKKRYRDYESLDSFLNDVTEVIDERLNNQQIQEMEQAIIRGIDNTFRIFVDRSYRKWPEGISYRYPVNKSLFEVWTVTLSGYEWNELVKHKSKIIEEFRKFCREDFDFDDSISRGTAKPASVTMRFSKITELIKAVGLCNETEDRRV